MARSKKDVTEVVEKPELQEEIAENDVLISENEDSAETEIENSDLKKTVIEEPDKSIEKKLYVYIGETIANHEINIKTNSVIGDLNKIKPLFLKYKGLEDLFVPSERYPFAKEKLKNPQSQLSLKIKDVSKKMRGE